MEKNTKKPCKTFSVKSNCGSIIISAANVVKWILSIQAILISCGITAGIYALLENWAGIPIGLIIMVFNVLIAIVLADMLKGYGEIVENSAISASALTYLLEKDNVKLRMPEEAVVEKRKTEEAVLKKTAEETGVEDVTVDEDGVHFHKVRSTQVRCPFCDNLQPRGAQFCSDCGQKFFYD